MSILTSLIITILSFTVVVEMTFEFGIGHLAVLNFFSGVVGEYDFLKLFADAVKVYLFFLNSYTVTAYLKGRIESIFY